MHANTRGKVAGLHESHERTYLAEPKAALGEKKAPSKRHERVRRAGTRVRACAYDCKWSCRVETAPAAGRGRGQRPNSVSCASRSNRNRTRRTAADRWRFTVQLPKRVIPWALGAAYLGDVARRGAVGAVAAPSVGAVGNTAGGDLRVPARDWVSAVGLVWPPFATLPRRQHAVDGVTRRRKHEAHVGVGGDGEHDDERGLLHDCGGSVGGKTIHTQYTTLAAVRSSGGRRSGLLQ
jgi:hypothetical protein